MEVHGHTVRGVDVGPETRCRHYDSELDVIAIRFPCCGTFYPCYECHLAAADHEPERWGDESGDGAPASVEAEGSADRTGVEDEGSTHRTGVEDQDSGERTVTADDADAVLCGICGAVLTVAEYVDCDDRCPDCGAEFNPGCRRHYDRYFASDLFETSA
ncbi:MAG: CHY zinc finger protein [Halolamina sp.]